MVLNYILLITLATMYPCLKTDYILSHRFIVIIGQLIPKAHRVLKRKKINGIIISSLNPIYLSESIFESLPLLKKADAVRKARYATTYHII